MASACFLITASPRHSNSYEVGAINLSTQELNGVALHSPDINAGFGTLEPGYDYKKTMGIYSTPMPTSGTVVWTTPDGKPHSAAVKIPAKPEPFDGILWLKIMPDGTAVAVPLTGHEYYDMHTRP